MNLLNFLVSAILTILALFVLVAVSFFLIYAFVWIVERICECPIEKESRLKTKAEKNKKDGEKCAK